MDKDKLSFLYSQGRSMAEIATLTNCSVHKIVYWMDKLRIKRRSISEAIYLKENPQGDPFKIKTSLSPTDQLLFGLGLGIYWGEGEKVSKSGVRVANTDPYVIKAFRRFLLEICQLSPRKISYSIVCFNDNQNTTVKQYWAKQLEISEGKFGKIVHIPSQGKGTYRKKSQFGVCTLTASNTKLKAWILQEISKLRVTKD